MVDPGSPRLASDPTAWALRDELAAVHVDTPALDDLVADVGRAGPHRARRVPGAAVMGVAAAVVVLLVAVVGLVSRPADESVQLGTPPPAAQPTTAPAPVDAVELLGTSYRSVDELPDAPLPDATLTLLFQDPTTDDAEPSGGDVMLGFGTHPGCNGGTVAIELDDDGTIHTVSSVISTAAGCPDDETAMDRWATDLITGQPTLLGVGEDRLRLTTTDGVAIDLVRQAPGWVATATPAPDTIGEPPPASVPPTANATDADGDPIAAEMLVGHMIGEGAGLGYVVRPIQGALVIPPDGVVARHWDGQAWQATPSERFGVNADAGLQAGRPFPAGVMPDAGAEGFEPGWYEVQATVVSRGESEPPATLTIGTRVIVPPPDADLSTLADVLPTHTTATSGDQTVEMAIDNGTLTIASAGSPHVTLPDVRVSRYDARGWIPGPTVVPQGTSLDPGQSIDIALDPLLDGADALRIEIGVLEPLYAALEYVG